MLLTAVEPKKKNRYAIYVEGEYAMHLDEETVVTERLRPGMEVTPEYLNELKQKADARRAKERAFTLLSYRSHTRHELTEKLGRDVDERTADAVADRMEELGLLDDEDYAVRYIAALLQKGYGGTRIRQELGRRGLDRELYEPLLEEALGREDASERIEAIVERKYLRLMNDEKGVNRTVNALIRLGYSYEDIRTALRAVRERLESGE